MARRARAGSRRLSAALGVLVFAAALSARAEPTAEEIKTARQLFADAEQLRATGDCEGAAAKLRQAIAIKETPGLRFHLAHCEERLGQLVLANGDYRRAAELIRSGANAPDVVRLLEPAQKSLAERLPTMRIRVPEVSPPARVRLDDTELTPEAARAFMPVDPGKHTVAVEANGYDPFLLELTIAEGEDRVVVAALRSRSAPAPAASVTLAPASALAGEPQREGSRFGAREVVVLGEAALAVAGAGIGVAYLLKREAADDDVSAHYARIDAAGGWCSSARSASVNDACIRLPDALQERAEAGNIAIAGFVGAGVFGAAAAATWFLWPSRSPRESSVVIAPFLGGATVRGAF